MTRRAATRLRRERTKMRRWEPFALAYVEVDAVRCTACGGTWPVDGDASHRRGCLDVEFRKDNP